MVDLNALTRAANELAPLPVTASRLASLLTNDRSTMREVEEAIAFDPALTARVLRMANSAAMAPATPVASVRQAVIRLGSGTVLSLVIAAAVKGPMQTSLPHYGLSEGELWRHSVAAALAARGITSFSKADVPADAFAAALLHDIGKLILDRFLSPEDAARIDAACREGNVSRRDAERSVIEVDHSEVGGLVAKRWNLPPRIVAGVLHHHTPEASNETTAYVVYVANLIAKSVGSSDAADALNDSASEAALARLSLRREMLPRLCKAVGDDIRAISDRFA